MSEHESLPFFFFHFHSEEVLPAAVDPSPLIPQCRRCIDGEQRSTATPAGFSKTTPAKITTGLRKYYCGGVIGRAAPLREGRAGG